MPSTSDYTHMRIFLVEDDPLWQQGVMDLLMVDPEIKLIGMAVSFQEAVDTLTTSARPDVVLTDWKLEGDQDGLYLGHWLLAEGMPADRIVLISGSHPDVIPPHPFVFIPKQQVATALLPYLKQCRGSLT